MDLIGGIDHDHDKVGIQYLFQGKEFYIGKISDPPGDYLFRTGNLLVVDLLLFESDRRGIPQVIDQEKPWFRTLVS